MLISCDCDNETFKLNFYPPMNVEVICTECGKTAPIGDG